MLALGEDANIHRCQQSGAGRDGASPSWRWTCRRSCRGDLEGSDRDGESRSSKSAEDSVGIQRKTLTLDDDVTVLAKGRALHGEGGRGPSAGLRSEEEREHWEEGEI